MPFTVDSRPEDAARFALVAKWKEIAAAYHEIEAQIGHWNTVIEGLRAEQGPLIEAANQCHATARLFGFVLEDAIADEGASAAPQQAVPAPKPAATPKIKDFVLIEAKQAYPNPVRSADLRAHLMNIFGREVHEKTIGMTLYRLLKLGLIRREDRDWFFVPPEERNTDLTSNLPDDLPDADEEDLVG